MNKTFLLLSLVFLGLSAIGAAISTFVVFLASEGRDTYWQWALLTLGEAVLFCVVMYLALKVSSRR